jgi:hypothetical protein
MTDELDRLHADKNLIDLLDHYAAPGEIDREAWQDRVMERAGMDRAALVRLHGELLAFEWIEQNTGIIVNPREGHVASCYRVTAAGLRALKRARNRDDEEEDCPAKAA